MLFIFPVGVRSQTFTLANAFAHNDYRHKRPLLDAENNGYTHIEADVFLHKGKLVVAHINPYFKSKRTLENLYLAPLFKQVAANNGNVYEGYNKPVTLMIDIKTDAGKTYVELKKLLEKYKPILSSYDTGKVTMRAVTIVLSGNKPYDNVKNEKSRLAFIDEDLRKVARDTIANVAQMASCKYSKLLKWKGNGTISPREKQRLCNYVTMAHKNGDQVRLWASPDNKAVWKEILSCGVDLINTDKLVALKDFLVSQKTSLAASN
ncbi:phosphatidylinositol-specific phospholipase C/glycerophosphodiester phosphodiesterase family protein [Mucilaginibacter sp. UR6-11]|uniref:phosphatidylinositol-specific phospholipase C/glycerophosphodiester phosphodiesterase family protein n=1 Tax=Mucilaginibacter sp. UR6-11 TaxID=1435644 RepID=UPI001E6429D4|nr:phosphatidylinositol-specific phospholipase C/glycerophosphodiester phosphodiesterase family protein [Mucilaginibacter sp. UR6-11]MCC8425382.1 phosphatidylinositol-specific phospholipase C/glycerophosphodiester phosphodiesterase family protein [Mucilaginibacter sp. UR6-11]